MDTKEQINIKEQAEIYAYKHLSMGCFDFDLYKQMLKIITKTYLDAYKKSNGYSNKLSEDKPKWHDLRKNPNDLPEVRKKVLLCIEIDGDFKVYIEGLYDKGECLEEYDSCWLYHEADKKVLTEIIDNQKVIAWCELPKFEE